MSRPDNVGNLSPDEYDRVEALLDRFDTAWRESSGVDLSAFLPNDALRPLVLLELIKSELEIRWRRGHPALVEEYLQRFPELRAQPDWLPALLFEEYLVRCHHGDRPSLSVYRERFPNQFAALEQRTRERPAETRSDPPKPPPPPSPAVGATPAALQGRLGRGDLLPVGDGYKLLQPRGSGAFGQVWEAEAPGRVQVAIKIVHRPLDHEEAQRELHSLELVKNIRHSFLIQTHAFWVLEDRLVISLELAECSLRDRLKACVAAGQPGVPLTDLLGYMRNASEALDFLHAREVLHRDIKPENILVVGPHAKLADFGLARQLLKKSSFTATLCGSMPYMPPEIWLGRAGPQSDQYSLAATYAELRLNRTLFPHGAIVGIMDGQSAKPANLAPLPEAEQRVLRRALSREPAERFTTCLEFCKALEHASVTRAVPTPVLVGVGGPPTPAPPMGSTLPKPPGSTVPVPPHADASSKHGSVYVSILNRTMPTSSRTSPPGKPPTWKSTAPASGRSQSWTGVILCVACGLLLLGLILLPFSSIWPSLPTPTATEPVPPSLYLPTTGTWEPDGPEPIPVESKALYKRIRRVLPDGKTHVVFLVMAPPNVPEGVAPFYIMETKVTNRMFEQFVAANPGAMPNTEWKKGARVNGADLGVEGDQRDCPVYRVTVVEACAFARWIAGDAGWLPDARQWDTAGGRFTRAPGPFTGPNPLQWEQGDFALASAAKPGRPMPVKTAHLDHSVFECWDMASNGFEWTSSLVSGNNENIKLFLPVPPEQKLDVSLRGMTYDASDPCMFLKGTPDSRDGSTRVANVSFRVVVNLPPMNELP